MPQRNARPLLAVLLLSLSTACDLGETIELRRPDLSPVLCPAPEATRFTVTFATKGSTEPERVSFVADPKGGGLSTRPPYPAIGLVAGSVEGGRLQWIQFEVFCGESTKAFLVTPKIAPQDLRKAQERVYHYIVENPGSKKPG